MKKWPFLLLLPVCVGATFCTNSLVQAREMPPLRVETQAELDAFAHQNSGANLDRLGHAFGNSEARLFWNTEFEAAKRQAVLEGKPILALRLLGNLSDEYSCANSRFFRVIFYPHSPINQRLRRDFVLFWSSERPVPVVTIDMGDGRVLKRTVTGNSAHYLLDSSGRPLDAFPGLTTPEAFDTWLASSKTLAQDINAQPQEKRSEWLANWHTNKLRESVRLNLVQPTPAVIDRELKKAMDANPLESTVPVIPISAGVAAPLAAGKRIVEGPMLRAFDLQPPVPNLSFSLAQFPSAPPLLDEATRARIRAMNPLKSTSQPSLLPVQNVALPQNQVQVAQKSSEETRFQNLIRSFETSLRSDTRQNRRFSIPIHALFARGHEGDLQSLNRRIYDRLFLTPRSDEWLGLTSGTAFSALQNDGVTLPIPSATN